MNWSPSDLQLDLPDAGSRLLWLVVLLISSLLAWAIIAELETIRVVPGRVVPDGHLQTVAAPLGGQVVKLHVAAGDTVQSGELLLELDVASEAAQLAALTLDSMALDARRQRLEGEGPGAAGHTQGLFGATTAAERTAGSARAAGRQADIAAARARSAEAAAHVSEALALLDARLADLEAATVERDVTRELVDRQIEPQIALVRANSRVRSLASEVAAARSTTHRARHQAKAAVASEISIKAKLDGDAAVELADVTVASERRKVNLEEARNRVAQQQILAPVSGIVQRVLVAGAGAHVQAGGTVLELVPIGRMPRIEARIPAEQAAFVHKGQKARVRFTAYDRSLYGEQEGKLLVLSPDSQLDTVTGQSYFLAEIELGSADLKSRRGTVTPITPGMTVEVVLSGERRRVISYLTSPLTSFLQFALREP